MADDYLFGTGKAFISGQEAVIGRNQAIANLQATQQQNVLRQDQITQLQEAANLKKQGQAAVQRLGAGAQLVDQLHAYSGAIAPTDPVTALEIESKANKLQDDNVKAKLDAYKLKTAENEAHGDFLNQLADPSLTREDTAKLVDDFLTANPAGKETTPEERNTRSQLMQIKEALNTPEYMGGKPLSDMKKAFATGRDSLQPEKARLKMEHEITLRQAAEARERDKQMQLSLQERLLEIKAAQAQLGRENKEGKAAAKKANDLNAEDNKYNTQERENNRDIREVEKTLSKLESDGKHQEIDKEKSGWGMTGYNKVYKPTQAYQNTLDELDSLKKKQADLERQHKIKLNRIDPEQYPLDKKEIKPKEEKTVATPSISIKDYQPAGKAVSGGYTVEQVLAAGKQAAPKATDEQIIQEAIRQGYISSREEERKPTSKESVKPMPKEMSQDEIRTRLAEIDKVITKDGSRISAGKISYIEAQNLREERRRLRQKLYS